MDDNIMPDNAANNDKITYSYKANNTNTSLVTYSFFVFALFSVFMFLVGIYFLFLLNQASQLQTESAKTNLINVGIQYDKLSFLISLIYWICALVFLFWIFRASRNTHSLYSQRKFEFTPGWCVGGYFIPLLNFFWPYKAMKELWLTNITNSSKNQVVIIAIWWITFLVMHGADTVMSKLAMHTVVEIQTFMLVSAISSLCGLISALLAVKIVREINKAQIAHNEELVNRAN